MSNPTKHERMKRIVNTLIEQYEKTAPDISQATGISYHIINAIRSGRPFKASDNRIELLRAYLEKLENEKIELPEEREERLIRKVMELEVKIEQQREYYEGVIRDIESKLLKLEQKKKKRNHTDAN